MSEPVPEDLPDAPPATAAARRKRALPGERRAQILQALAAMLEESHGEKITTAALAARLQASEAALYRHFASKAKMYEELIAFIEHTLFGLVNQIAAHEEYGVRQAQVTVRMLLEFATQNRGLTRVLVGEALTGEDQRLQERMNHLMDRLEASLKQCLRNAAVQGAYVEPFDLAARANLLMSLVLGRWQRYALSGFKKNPLDGLEAQLRVVLA